MFQNRENHRERKLQICDRVRARGVPNRRPITEVLEIRLENFSKTTSEAFKDRDEAVYRPLLAFSLFQND